MITVTPVAGLATVRSDRVAIHIPTADLPRIIAELVAVQDALEDAL